MHNDVLLTNCGALFCSKTDRWWWSSSNIGSKSSKRKLFEMKTQFPTFEIEIVEVSLSFFDRVALTAKMYRIFWAASTSIPLFSHKKIIIFHLFLPLPNTAAFAWLPGCLHWINCRECNFTRFTFTQKEFLQIIIKSLQNAHFGSRQAREETTNFDEEKK